MEDNKTLLTQITGECFTHICRNANGVADRVAKFATHIDMTLGGSRRGREGTLLEARFIFSLTVEKVGYFVNHIRSCFPIRWLSVLVDTDRFVVSTDSWLTEPCPANIGPKYGNTTCWREFTLVYLVFHHYP
ncbi:hypothetical protein ACE6H2_019535 [Prunus campanulata]